MIKSAPTNLVFSFICIQNSSDRSDSNILDFVTSWENTLATKSSWSSCWLTHTQPIDASRISLVMQHHNKAWPPSHHHAKLTYIHTCKSVGEKSNTLGHTRPCGHGCSSIITPNMRARWWGNWRLRDTDTAASAIDHQQSIHTHIYHRGIDWESASEPCAETVIRSIRYNRHQWKSLRWRGKVNRLSCHRSVNKPWPSTKFFLLSLKLSLSIFLMFTLSLTLSCKCSRVSIRSLHIIRR